MTSATDELGAFLDYFWADTNGWVYTPISEGVGVDRPDWKPLMWHWPKARPSIILRILQEAADPNRNVFFSPAMFVTSSPRKEAVMGSRTLWVDYDGNAPQAWPEQQPEGALGTLWVPPPTLRVQSSLPGHEHCYWALDEFVTDVDWIDDRNRAIAYATAADTSGWDSNQVLRPPHTVNRKPNRPAMPVTILSWDL